jgi:hypothetical protein
MDSGNRGGLSPSHRPTIYGPGAASPGQRSTRPAYLPQALADGRRGLSGPVPLYSRDAPTGFVLLAGDPIAPPGLSFALQAREVGR